MPKPMLTASGFDTFFATVAMSSADQQRIGEQQVRTRLGVER